MERKTPGKNFAKINHRQPNASNKKEKRFTLTRTLALSALSFYLTLIVSSTAAVDEDCYQEMEIPALGRTAALGYLYDEQSDTIRDVSIFKSVLPNDVITTISKPDTTIQTGILNTFADRFRLFDIPPSTAANILAGISNPERSSVLLTQEKSSAHEVEGILLLKYQTVKESLQIYYENLKPLYNTHLLHHKTSTHVVTGITWGANIGMTFKATANGTTESVEHLKTIMKTEFKKLQWSKGLNTSNGTNGDDALSTYSTEIRSDIPLPIEIPTNHKEIKQLLNQIPSLIQNVNGGKGVPLKFRLTPLQLLRKHVGESETSHQQRAAAHKLNDWVIKDLIHIFDATSAVQQRIGDLQGKFIFHSNCVTPTVLNEMAAIETNFTKFKSQFISSFEETLISVRRGLSPSSALTDLTETFHQSDFSAANIERQFSRFNIALTKIQVYNTIQGTYKQIEYFGSHTQNDLESTTLENLEHMVYILFQKTEWIQSEREGWEDSLHLFLKKLYQPYNKLLVVDCDFEYSQCLGLNSTIIKQLRNGRVSIENVKSELQEGFNAKALDMEAIGLFAQIGDLYDLRTDRFIGRSILQEGYPRSLIYSTAPVDVPKTNKYAITTYDDKFKALGVRPELQLSAMGGLRPLVRTGRYLAEPEIHPSMCIVHNRRLKMDELDLAHSKLPSNVLLEEANLARATHFVSKIMIGFNTVFSIKNHNVSLLKRYADQLSAVIESIKFAKVNQSLSLEATAIKVSSENVSIAVYSDAQELEDQPLAIESEDALAKYLAGDFVQGQMNQNSGQGQPIAYTLYPISNLRSDFGALSPATRPVSTTQSGTMPNATSFAGLLQGIKMAEFQLQGLLTQIEENMDCVTDEDLRRFEKIQQTFKSTIGGFTTKFREIVAQVHSGNGNYHVLLEKLWKDYENVTFLNEKGHFNGLQEMKSTVSKMTLYSLLKGRENVRYFGRPGEKNGSLLEGHLVALSKETPEGVTVVYYNPLWAEIENDAESWRNLSQLLLGDSQSVSNTTKEVILVNCEFSYSLCANMSQPSKSKYFNGFLLREYEENRLEFCSNRKKNISPGSNGLVIDATTVSSVQTLACGGKIALPQNGSSILLDFKYTQMHNGSTKCLWTLDNTQAGTNTRYNFRVQAAVVCENFVTPEDTVSIFEWKRYYGLLSYKLTNQREVYPPLRFGDAEGLYLSFSSPDGYDKTGFIVSIQTVGRNPQTLPGYNWSYSSKPGSISHGPYKDYERVSIVINPPNQSTTLTVNYIYSENYHDRLFIYEVTGRGFLNALARLTGNITTAISYEGTSNPILMVFTSDGSVTGPGFHASWT